MKLLILILLILNIASAKVVARIDREQITSAEVQQAFNAYWREILHLPIARSTQRDLQEFLVEYVRSKIIQMEAKRMGISVSPQEFEEYVERHIGSKRLSDVAKELITTEILSQKIINRIARDLDVKDGQITAYYYLNLRDFKLPAQVLLERYTTSSLDTANEVYYSLSRGQPVRSVEVRVGQPMWYSIQTLPEIVRRQLYPYEVGKTTRPIEVGGSYVIFRIANRRGSGIMPLEEAKPIVREKLLREKRQEVFQRWFQEVSKRYSVEFYFGQL
ncbi:peptidylprolyl isomerase [Hydrogenobacter sp. T-2]|uniref:peptidylprolyl isomerase n=1 Tax=Pampinifervens diazotrophicum TaxID=1632018 RepID=UPI002B258B64|nr:peptidylprolyl isomerase [Hydrogenobacter sp. T-2]WPM31777.1 peptidylprolyl isomerase [Hydrogenobacter sp. T-2]